ncbi:MAG: AAA family ATPase [Micromonosporaceae bacterium]
MARFAEAHETHAGVVFLLGDRAYKLKKPVDLGFLDFRTLASRRQVCLREVELNRRFSPDVYLGVDEVRDPDGEPCEYLVVMRRMPPERRLKRLVTVGEPVADDVRQLARQLAAFHSTARRDEEISAEGARDALRQRWVDTFEQVRPFHELLGREQASEVERLTLRFLDGRDDLFAARIADGRVVDGHGDLITEDVFCLPDGPRVLDCLEFDDRLRYVDGLDDAAFLAAELERLGAYPLAEQFLDWYAEFAADPAPATLRHHYIAYRAYVRAKVACLRHDQGDPDAAADARQFAAIAWSHLRAGAVRLIVVGGLPGSGKSTLAGALADRLGAVLHSSDRTRKSLAGIDPMQRAGAAYQEGIYTPEWTDRTYDAMLERAGPLLAQGESVVLDASFAARRHREAAEQLAGQTASDLVAVRCEAPDELIRERVATRAPGPSDADLPVVEEMAAEFDPWPTATAVDTSGPPGSAVTRVLQQMFPV